MKKVKEDIWDEISEIENGGQEGYYGDDWEDLLDPEKAERVHRDAQDLGMSDLDCVNREEKLEGIEDDFAYEIESDDNISITDFNESPLRSFTDVFEEFLGEMEQEGEVHTGYYFHKCRDVNDLCNEVLQMQLDGFEETYGIGFDLVKNGVVNAWVVLSDALNVLSKYTTKDYPKCNACFEMLVRLAKEYNETLKEFNITEWPRMVTIPSVDGSLNEASAKRNSKKSLTEGVQLFYVFIKFQNGTTSNEVIEFSHAMEELYPEADWANPTRDTIVAQNVNMEVAEDILEDAFEIPSYRNYLTTPQSVTIER